MTYNRVKNIYIGAILISIFSFLGAVLIHLSTSFPDLAVLKVVLLGIGCGLLPLIINLTKMGLLTIIIQEISDQFRVPSKTTVSTVTTVNPELKENPRSKRHSA